MTDQLLLDYVRGLGVACGSIHQGRHVGWTTDEAKADAARAAGASLAAYTSREPSASGWEVSFLKGSVIREPGPDLR